MGTSLLENRYKGVRRHLDKLGYLEAFPVDALLLVERLLLDLSKTTDKLDSAVKKADHFSKVLNSYLITITILIHFKLLVKQEQRKMPGCRLIRVWVAVYIDADTGDREPQNY